MTTETTDRVSEDTARPETWEDVQRFAESDDPRKRFLAFQAACEAGADEKICRAYFSHWAATDPENAGEYERSYDETRRNFELALLAGLNRKQRRRRGYRGRLGAHS